ncbi:hypothetical protein J2X72_004549 [Phyllobacterium sp. 1468]|nr:hypothetical protein [Phyllobacterium sp. 1468]
MLPFHECAHPARQIAPVRYDEAYGKRPATKIGHDFPKRSIPEVLANPQGRSPNQTKADEGSSVASSIFRQKLRVQMRTAVRPMFNGTIREYNTKKDDFLPPLSKISGAPSSAFAAVTAV